MTTWAELMEELPEPHTVTVEPYAGEGAYGKVYGTAVEVTPCLVVHKRRRVRVSTQDAAGAEVLSSTTVYCAPGTVAPPESRVTLASGLVAKVLDAADWDGAGMEVTDLVELLLE